MSGRAGDCACAGEPTPRHPPSASVCIAAPGPTSSRHPLRVLGHPALEFGDRDEPLRAPADQRQLGTDVLVEEVQPDADGSGSLRHRQGEAGNRGGELPQDEDTPRPPSLPPAWPASLAQSLVGIPQPPHDVLGALEVPLQGAVQVGRLQPGVAHRLGYLAPFVGTAVGQDLARNVTDLTCLRGVAVGWRKIMGGWLLYRSPPHYLFRALSPQYGRSEGLPRPGRWGRRGTLRVPRIQSSAVALILHSVIRPSSGLGRVSLSSRRHTSRKVSAPIPASRQTASA